MVDENQELNTPEMGDNVPELSEGESQDVNPNINNNMEKEANDNEASPDSEDSSQPEATNRGALEYRLRQQNRKLDRRLEQFESRITEAIARGLSQTSIPASQMPAEDSVNTNSQSSVQQVNPNEVQKLVNQALQEKEAIATQNTFNQYEEAAKRKFNDYNEVIEDLVHSQAITPLMVETIKDLPDAPELIYSIAKSNPQEFERISKLSPVQQMREMAFAVAKHQPSSNVPHRTEEAQNEQQPQVKPNPHKPLSPVSNRGGSMSHGSNNYGFEDRLSELAAGYHKSRP
jgi:hypothetical protein